MKKIMLGFMALAISFASIAQAETKKHKVHIKGDKKEMRVKGGRGFEDMKLSDAQKTRMKTINESYRDKMKDLNANKSLSVEAQKQSREALRNEHKSQIQALLTADQKKQWEEKRKQHSFKGKDGKARKSWKASK